MAGSSSGQAAIELWHALSLLGRAGIRDRALAAQATAEYAVGALGGAGWPAWRHPHGYTVVFDAPPSSVAVRWAPPVQAGQSHIVCVPGVTTSP